MEQEISLEKSGSNQFQWEKGVFPQPSHVLEASLQKIEPDGSVMYYEEEGKFWFPRKGYDPVPLHELSLIDYNRHLMSLVNSIEGTMIEISLDPKTAEENLRRTAVTLTAYRHSRDFLNHAASLLKITDKGSLISPIWPDPS